MFHLQPFIQNKINVRIISATDAKTTIDFASSIVSPYNDFIRRLKPIIVSVISTLREQQPDNISFHVRPSLSFNGKVVELSYPTNLKDFDVNEVLQELKLKSNANDGGYFTLEITNPRIFIPDIVNFFANHQPLDFTDSDSDNESVESESE